MRLTRSDIVIALLFVIALVFRLFYFFEYHGFLEFSHPTVDALYHHLSAMAIASGALTAAEPFFRAPLYNYFLGVIYWPTGNDIALARALQLLIGSFTPLLVFLIGRKVFDRRCALVAALLALLCGDLVYFEGELLLEFLATTLILLTWLACLSHRSTGRFGWLYLAGFLAGLAIITRPNMVIMAPMLLWLLYQNHKSSHRSKLVSSVRLLAMMLIPLVMVLFHNLTRDDPALAIATQGGINFYLGNNLAADGVSAVMPGKLGYNWQYQGIKHLAEQQIGERLTPSQISSFYYRKAVSEILAEPFHWLSLLLKKFYLFFSGADISNNRNLIAFKSQFTTLKFLPIGMWLLGAVGIIGMITSWRRHAAARTLAAFVLLYALTFALFFVNSRFRLPTLPLLALFSGYTLVSLYDMVQKRSLKRFALIATGCIALLLLSSANIYRLDFDNRRQAHYSKGNLLLATGDNHSAIASYLASLASDNPLKQVHLNLGIAHLRLGNLDSARNYFLIEDSLFGGSAEALNNLSYLARQEGDYALAAFYARRALVEKPHLEDARLNLWHSWREAGFSDSAYSDIVARQQMVPLSLQEKFLLAVTALDLGLHRVAAADLKDILTDLDQPVQPSYSELSAAPTVTDDRRALKFRSKVLYNLGTAFGIDRKLDSAILFLDSALIIDPSLVEAWVNLGTAHFSQREFLKAIEAFREAVELGTESEILFYNLGLAHLALADTTAAVDCLEKCLSINPDFAPPRQLLGRLR